MDLTRDIHDRMARDHLLFVYRGEITEKNSLSMLTLLENEMKDDLFSFVGRKRLFMFVLESLQNIIKHGDHTHHAGMSLVTYSKNSDGYTITTGNIIDSVNVNDLKNRLETMGRLKQAEIKNLYKQILTSSKFSEKGGAGLGLIEMAIKTGNKLDFDFIPVDDDHSFFILSKSVDSMGTGIINPDNDKPFDSSSVLGFERMMAANKIHMVWSGHVSSEINEEVLSLAEWKLRDEDVDSGVRKRVFSIMDEILENVSKYNPGKEAENMFGMPVVMVRINDRKFLITAGNLISGNRAGDLKDKLDYVNSLDRNGLKDNFYSSLSQQTIETDSTGNMGLLAVARKSGSRLDYRFEQVNHDYSYFMLTVKVEEPSFR
jgi:hypothetical protein